jgi:N-acetylglucosaminyldiphosphoundecaprenol N-acetyl-beta-D-mannosaminyltransferase
MPIFPDLNQLDEKSLASREPAVNAPAPVATPTSQVDLPPRRTTNRINAGAPSEPMSEKASGRPQAAKVQDRFQRGPTSTVWDLPLDRLRMEGAVDAIEAMVVDRKPRYVITANLNYAMLLSKDESLQAVTDDAAMILADGQPMVWRSMIGRSGRLPERIAGSELIYRLAERGAIRKWRFYFLGAEPGVAQRCADTLAKRYPGLQVAGVQSPPFRRLTEDEQWQQRQAIVDSRADILLVAFGQPKGERWIHENYQALGVPVSIQLGASFDFVAGTLKRAPKMWQRLGLEWAYRMFNDPVRLIPRYAVNAWFLGISIIRDWRDYVNENFSERA